MARMIRCEFRIPAGLKAAAEAEAKAQGLDLSEFIRHALLAWLVGVQTARAAKVTDPAHLFDIDTLMEVVRQISDPDNDEKSPALEGLSPTLKPVQRRQTARKVRDR